MGRVRKKIEKKKKKNIHKYAEGRVDVRMDASVGVWVLV